MEKMSLAQASWFPFWKAKQSHFWNLLLTFNSMFFGRDWKCPLFHRDLFGVLQKQDPVSLFFHMKFFCFEDRHSRKFCAFTWLLESASVSMPVIWKQWKTSLNLDWIHRFAFTRKRWANYTHNGFSGVSSSTISNLYILWMLSAFWRMSSTGCIQASEKCRAAKIGKTSHVLLEKDNNA